MPFGVTLFQNSAIMVTLHGSSNRVQGIEEIILPGINRVIIINGWDTAVGGTITTNGRFLIS